MILSIKVQLRNHASQLVATGDNYQLPTTPPHIYVYLFKEAQVPFVYCRLQMETNSVLLKRHYREFLEASSV